MLIALFVALFVSGGASAPGLSAVAAQFAEARNSLAGVVEDPERRAVCSAWIDAITVAIESGEAATGASATELVNAMVDRAVCREDIELILARSDAERSDQRSVAWGHREQLRSELTEMEWAALVPPPGDAKQ